MKVSLKESKPRDILKFQERDREGFTYVTLVESSGGDGFYMYYSNEYGVPSKSERIYHTNMIFTDDLEKVGELPEEELVKYECFGIEYHESTEYEWINEQLGDLGPKYQIFSKNCTPALEQEFENNEEANNHYANKILVNKFIKNLSNKK